MTERELRARLESAQARRVAAQQRLGRQLNDESLVELRRALATQRALEGTLDTALAPRREALSVHEGNRSSLDGRVRSMKFAGVGDRLAHLVLGGSFLTVGAVVGAIASYALESRFGPLPWFVAFVPAAALAGFCGWRLGRM